MAYPLSSFVIQSADRGFRRMFRSEPSSGVAAGFFAAMALPMLECPNSLNDELLRVLARAVTETRPFPATKWARMILADDFDREAVKAGVRECLASKEALPGNVGKHGRDLADRLKWAPGDLLFALGLSETVFHLLNGLSPDRHMTVVSPILNRAGHSEGAAAVNRLKDRTNHRASVVEDTDAQRLLRGEDGPDLGAPAALLFGCSLVGLGDHRRIEVVSAYGTHDYVNLAHKYNVPTVLVVGTYKIWNHALYNSERASLIAARGEAGSASYVDELSTVRELSVECRTFDVLSAELISHIVSEDGIFSADEFANRYHEELGTGSFRPTVPMTSSPVLAKSALLNDINSTTLLDEIVTSDVTQIDDVALKLSSPNEVRALVRLMRDGYVFPTESFLFPTARGMADFRGRHRNR